MRCIFIISTPPCHHPTFWTPHYICPSWLHAFSSSAFPHWVHMLPIHMHVIHQSSGSLYHRMVEDCFGFSCLFPKSLLHLVWNLFFHSGKCSLTILFKMSSMPLKQDYTSMTNKLRFVIFGVLLVYGNAYWGLIIIITFTIIIIIIIIFIIFLSWSDCFSSSFTIQAPIICSLYNVFC